MSEENFLKKARQIAGALNDTPLSELHNYIEPCDSHLLHHHMTSHIYSQAAEISALRERVKELQSGFSGLLSGFGQDDDGEWISFLDDADHRAFKALLSTRRGEG